MFTTVGTISVFVLGVIFAGFTIRYLGEARAGYFLALQALLSMNGVIGGQAFRGPAIQRLATLPDRGNAEARAIVGTLLTLNVLVGITLGLALCLSFGPVYRWSRLDLDFRADAAWTTILTAGGFLVEQAAGAFRVAYDARRRFDIITIMSTVFGVIQNVGRVLVLRLAPSMANVALVGLVVSLVWCCCDVLLTRRMLGGFSWPTLSRGVVRSMLSFGLWSWLGNLAGFLSGSLDRIVLTSFMGAKFLPYYAMPQRLVSQVHVALANQLYFIFPMLASRGGDAKGEIRRVEDRLRWFVAGSSALVYGLVAVCGPAVIRVLVSPEFADRALVPLWLACVQGLAFSQIRVYFYSTWAVGEAGPNVLPDIVSNVLMILTACVLIPWLGYIGASIAQLWRVPFVIWHTVWCRRVLGLRPSVAESVEPLVGPAAALVSAVATIWLGSVTLGLDPYEAWVFVGVGVPVGLLVGRWVELRYFPDRMRVDTLFRALRLLLGRPLGRAAVVAGQAGAD